MRLLKFIYSGEGKATFLLLKFKLKAPFPHTLSLVSTKDTKAKKKEKKKRQKEGGGQVYAAEKPFWEYLVQLISLSYYLTYKHR